jgi:CRP/FNR family cyclic AMP-dependent transcriptional regulator
MGVLMELERLGGGPAYRSKVADMLEKLPLLSDFSRSELEQLARHMSAFRAPKGYVLFSEGSPNDAMWLLIEGRVEIVKRTQDARNCHITTVTPGKSLGEMSVIDGMPYSATGSVLVDSLLIQMTRSGFDTVCETLPKLGVKILRRLARLMSMRLRQTSGALVQLVEG